MAWFETCGCGVRCKTGRRASFTSERRARTASSTCSSGTWHGLRHAVVLCAARPVGWPPSQATAAHAPPPQPAAAEHGMD
jgi:hypothetical protein